MKLIAAYGLISFAICIGVSAIGGRLLNVPWLFGQFESHENDPGMAVSTAVAVIALGFGVFLLHSFWRNGKHKTKEEA